MNLATGSKIAKLKYSDTKVSKVNIEVVFREGGYSTDQMQSIRLVYTRRQMRLHEKANAFALYLASDLYCTCHQGGRA